MPAGRSGTAFIDARDIGRVAASLLTTTGHLQKAYTLSGEQSLTYRDVARTMTGVLGRPIGYAPLSERDYLAELAVPGFPDDYRAVQRMIHRVVRLTSRRSPTAASAASPAARRQRWPSSSTTTATPGLRCRAGNGPGQH